MKEELRLDVTLKVESDLEPQIPVVGTSHKNSAVEIECIENGEYFEEDYVTNHEPNVVHDKRRVIDNIKAEDKSVKR